MNKIYKTLYLKALMLVMITGLFAFSANAQTYPTNTPPVGPYFMGEEATYTFQANGFDAGTLFFLYYDLDNDGVLDEDEVLGSSSTQDADVDLTFDWPIVLGGTVSRLFRLGAYTGNIFQDNALTLDEDDFNRSVVGTNNANFNYGFSRAGVRYYQTEVLDLSTTEDKTLSIRLDDNGLDLDNPINVEFSTNGGETFTAMVVATASVDVALEGETNLFGFVDNQTFTFDIPVDNEATILRVSQVDANGLGAGEKTWDLNAFFISIGDVYTNVNFAQNSFQSVNEISVDVFEVTDASDNPVVTVYPGDEDVKIRATIDDIDLANYEFAGYIQNQNSGEIYLLENQTSNEDGALDEITITGDIPVDVLVYNENWNAFVVAFNGADPAFGTNLFAPGANLDTDDDVESTSGYNTVSNDFDGDEERSFTTIPFNVQAVTNGLATLDLARTSAGLAAPGTEIVFEYSTDGTDFTQVGDAISLNADLSESIEIDLSAETDLISANTQFRVRQLANNGLDLDTWSATLTVSLGGNILVDDSEGGYFDYTSSSIFIAEPVIILDPVNVPDDLIFPGDELTLVYNITNGAFPEGTTIHAELTFGQDFILGTSAEIAPGDDVDNEIDITVPPIPGGDYSVSLVSMTGSTSNSVSLPIYETTVTITSVDSDNGIFDGTVDVIYPGDEVTVNYDIDGSVGAGAELLLEYYDYDEDDFVILTSTQTIDGVIAGTLPTGVNLNDGGNARLRIRIGNGLLASNSTIFPDNEAGINMNASISDVNFFNYFNEELVVGNDPTDVNDLIGSGERSATTIAGPAPFGGLFWIWFDGESYDSEVGPQTVTISASNDGTDFVDIGEFDYEGQASVQFGSVEPALELPESVWGESVVFKVSYNEDGAAGEFENVIEIDAIVLFAYDAVQANSSEFDITASGQFRNFTISLEEINDPVTYVVGEEVTIEYTTEGTFPAETGFALIFEGDLDDGFGGPDYDDGEEFFTVVATSTDQGSGSFTFNVPDIAYEFDGTDSDFDLYDRLTVVAYDGTGGADFLPNELIIVDSDDQFLVLGGTDESDGSYTFDLAGDRSALTIAFDISTVQSANLNFTYNSGIGVDDNILTIPQLQYSINGGESFVNIEVEDSGLEGGYLVGSQAYSVEVPAEAITAATHFRWVQDLNLGAGQDTWSISGISIELINGNEITSAYNVVNDDQTIAVAHPSTDDYVLSQVDPNDAIFNGESSDLTFDPIFETSDAFPANTTFDYLLYDVSAGDYVIDPETNDPLVVGTSSAVGAFTATIPFYVENGSYQIRLVASKSGAEEPYYYVGAANDGINIGTIEVFLRVLSTTVEFDANDVLYAGSTVTVSVNLENDESNLASLDDLFATLYIENFDGGDDLILATQQGVSDFTVDLPPYVRGADFTFIVKLSEESLGEPGDLIGDDGELTNLEQDADNFINQPQLAAVITTPVFEGSSSVNEVLEYTYTYDTDDNNTLGLFYNRNNTGWVYWRNLTNSDQTDNFDSWSFNISDGETIQWRWLVFEDEDGLDGNTLKVTGVEYGNVALDDTELSPMSMVEAGVLAFTNDFGRGLITTREFEAGELANSTLVSFDLTFGKLAEDITADQFLIFEYSVNGGESFTEIATFPDVDDEMTLNGENFLFNLGDLANDVKSNNSIFRFRQEERNDINVMIDNFSFLPGETLPFEYVSDNQVVAPQVVLVTGIGSDESCLDGEIVLDYEVRGSFGADVEFFIGYELVGGESDVFADPVTGITGGTGSLEGFVLPSTLFLEGDNNKNFRFRINYDDQTFKEDFDIEYSSDSEPASENSVEVVAPIDQDANFSVGDVTECSGDEVEVTISNPQDYFMYEVLNADDGTVLGTLIYDPEEGDNEINLGVLPLGLTDLELQITSMTSSGTECSTLISTDEKDVEVLEDFALYFDDNVTLDFAPIADGTSFTFCEGSGNGGRLAAYRALADGTGISQNTDVEWYLDDINSAPLNFGSELNFSSLNKSGTYFALVFDGECSYVTTSIEVTIPETPDQPEIEIVSGNLAGCIGDDPVVLRAPEGFAYYAWSTGETSREIEVDRTVTSPLTVNVRVSNVPFAQDGNCGSAQSDNLEIVRYNQVDFNISTSTSFDDQIIEGEALEVCDGRTIYFFNDQTYSTISGTIEVIRDGSVVETYTNRANVFLDESGVYQFNFINDDIGLTNSCTALSESFTLTVVEAPEDIPVITVVSGNLVGCDTEDPVVLRGPDGFDAYFWSNGERSQEIIIDLSGNDSEDVTLEVANETSDGLFSCFSPESSEILVQRFNSYDFNLSTSTSIEDIIFDGEVVEECEDNLTVYFYDEDVRTSGNGRFEIVVDGSVIGTTTSSSYTIEESGVYSFNYINNSSSGCTSSSVSFTVNLVEIPAAPVIEASGDLAFCEGEGAVTLTVTSPATAAQYRWLRNGLEISSNQDGFGNTSSSIIVTEDGDYTVQVSNFTDEDGCYSPESNAIEVNVRATLSVDATNTLKQDDVNCGSGSITFIAGSTDGNLIYQLVNESTGQPSGAAVRGSGGGSDITLVSDDVEESTSFQLMVMYADGVGCEYLSTDAEFGTVNNVILELDGNDLVANISGNWNELKWYRVTGSGNIELRNKRNETSLTLTDGSEYLVEVDFEEGCMISVSSATVVAPTARIEAVAGLEVNAYPNPAVDQITINLDGGVAGDYDLSIVDMSGRVELSSTIEKDEDDMEVSIDLTNLEAGIYNLVIRQGGKVESVRIVKQ